MKGVNSELMAQPGFSPGACLLAAVFRPQSEPHRHVKGGRPFEQAPRLPLGQIRLRDRQIAAASLAAPSSPRAPFVSIDISARCRLACPFAV